MRNLLYKIARLLGDFNALFTGRIGKRAGRRVAGRLFGRFLRKF